MEEISIYDIDFSQNIELMDKKIKGIIHFKDFKFHQATFENCVFERIFFSSNGQKAETYFQFTKCKINRIEINCFVDHICINDSQVHSIKQEKGETRFLEIFCDEAVKNYINYLMLFNSTCKQLSLKGYRINTLSLRDLKVPQSLTIEDVTVIQNFTIVGCFIKEGSILNTTSKSNFSLAKLQPDTDLYLGYMDCHTFRFVDKLRNLNLIINKLKCKLLFFQNFEVINTTFKLNDIIVSEELRLLESDFGSSHFVDCDFTKCRTLISFPVLTSIRSLNLNFSDNVEYFNQIGDAAKEKKIAELMEFYRQLKYNALSQHNQYKSLTYYSKEMNWYYKSLKNLGGFSSKFGVKNKYLHKVMRWLFEWIYDLYDLVIHSALKKRNPFEGFRVWVFKYTNNFGIDWIRPSLIYIVLSYLLFIIASENYDFTKSIQFSAFIDPDFPKFLNPINKFSFSDATHPGSFKTALAELFAIIVQGFLIYQIIRGFRKYVLK